MEQVMGSSTALLPVIFRPKTRAAAQGQSRYKAEKEQDTAEENGVIKQAAHLAELAAGSGLAPGDGSLVV